MNHHNQLSPRPRIIGAGRLPFVRAFDHVADALDIPEVLLGACFAGLIGEHVPGGSIVYNMEPLHDGCCAFEVGYLDTLRQCHVLDYQRRNVEYLASLGIEAFHLPFGYHPSLERCEPADRDIDVLMVGTMSPRRMQVLTALTLAGVNVRYVHGVHGQELDQLVARARAHVNIHRYDGHPLEVVRLNYLMANKACVVSEPGWDPEETRAYAAGVTFCDYSEIVDTVIQLLGTAARIVKGFQAREIIRAMPFHTKAARDWLVGRAAGVAVPSLALQGNRPAAQQEHRN
jgi:hypothetical protein